MQMKEEMGDWWGPKLTDRLQSNMGRPEVLPKEFGAVEMEAHPSFGKDSYMIKCWFKDL